MVALIIRNNDDFRQQFHTLDESAIVCGRLRLAPGEEHLLLDLLHRGVRCIPSALAQLASRSKVFQARLFTSFMVPHTVAVYDIHSMLATTSLFHQEGFGEVVVKQDRKNGGSGIHRFNNIEDVFNHAEAGGLRYPFVIQPFQHEFTDLRVILLGDYLEVYERYNPANFRRNLHCGGTARPYQASETVLAFCKRVMARGGFPYAHLDLMVTADNTPYLSEINLRGGLRGARLKGQEYRQRLTALHEQLLGQALATANPEST